MNAAQYIIERNACSSDKDRIALYWDDGEGNQKTFSFGKINKLSNKFANCLLRLGVEIGDRVFFFLPRLPEIYYGFIGAIKTGAIPGTLFPAFGEDALRDRLKNSGAKILITTKGLNTRVERIRSELPLLEKIVLIDDELPKLMNDAADSFETISLDQNAPLFMLYTSSTGNTPVCGIVIPHKAIIQQYSTAEWALDLKKNDVYWCTADPGWVTGIVYGILAPWALGISQIAFAGRFDPAKWLSIIKRYKVSVLYTAPTAIRMIRASGIKIDKNNLSSLRYIASVGEPLNASLIEWSSEKLDLPIHDTWWQTETGAIMIANNPALDIKFGSMGKPAPGITAAIIDDNGREVADGEEGNLAIRPGWPAMMIDIWENRHRYESYFKNGWYLTGDWAKRDRDGYFWFIGRADDIIKTSGERIGPFEVESVLIAHPAIVETCVIGKPDPLRGEIIKAFLVLKPDINPSEELKTEIQSFAKAKLAGHAYPREIEFVNSLPKNKSGKILRRVLKAHELTEMSNPPKV